MQNEYIDENIFEDRLVKTLQLDEFDENKRVSPDIIIHRRNSEHNFLIIEVKMEWKNDKSDFDFMKIEQYIEQLGYQNGVYVQISDVRENCELIFAPFE